MFEQNNEFYKPLLNSQGFIAERFSNLDIILHPDWKRVGVNLSGGADSAMLTFLLCTAIQRNKLDIKVNAITHTRCWEIKPWQGWWSLQVFNKLKSMFPDIIDQQYTNFIPTELEHANVGLSINGKSGDQIIVESFNKFISWNGNLDAIYNATSQNPDQLSENRMRNRDLQVEDGHIGDLIWKSVELKTYFLHPLKFVKKDWIVAQYHIHDLLDLYHTTRSCEGSIPLHDNIRKVVPNFQSYEDGMDVPLCNECWWCEERNWAESRFADMLKEINDASN